MTNYIVDIKESEKYHAGPKAKEDISIFLSSIGYKRLYIDSDVSKLSKYLSLPLDFNYKISKMDRFDTILFQHPMNLGKELETILVKKAKKRVGKIAVVIHDINSLRNENRRTVESEINFLNLFDTVISHNKKMTEYLKSHGLKSKCFELQLFDYLVPNFNSLQKIKTISNRVVFAGNLSKSRFLTEYNIETELNLYGNRPDKITSNTVYHGSFTPSILVDEIESGFGLVWDGDSIDTCDGVLGKYLKYNNPHKVSLYLASGIPIIMWREAALASYIVENNLGIVVDSLRDIPSILSKLSRQESEIILESVRYHQERVRNGYFIKNVVSRSDFYE